MAASRAPVTGGSTRRLDPSRLTPDTAGSSPSHPALTALARLLARQISRSEVGNG